MTTVPRVVSVVVLALTVAVALRAEAAERLPQPIRPVPRHRHPRFGDGASRANRVWQLRELVIR